MSNANADNEADILRELGRIIGQHGDWLSGRDFQRLALHAAEGYFPADDLDCLCRPEDLINALRNELQKNPITGAESSAASSVNQEQEI